jgi:hypothetical protein
MKGGLQNPASLAMERLLSCQKPVANQLTP